MSEYLENIRRRYLPDEVRLLFIGESPPASGRFFYNRDSGLYRAILWAFQAADNSITEDNFLERFKASGCYLIDLCREPIDRLDQRRRQDARRRGEAALAAKVRRHQPDAILVLLKSIQPNVLRALRRAGWAGKLISAPYPARWVRHRAQFLEIAMPAISFCIFKKVE